MTVLSAPSLAVRCSAREPRAQGRLSPAIFYAVVTPLLVGGAVAGVVVGSTPVDWSVVVEVLAVKTLPESWTASISVTRADEAIVWLIRLPRVLVAACVGAALATAGAMMQSLFRNPLGEPTLVGVGPGAVFGAVAVFVSVGVGVLVSVGGIGVLVSVGVAVLVLVGVFVGVAVLVGVAVFVGVGVLVLVGVFVGVGVPVFVGVFVGVGVVGVGHSGG